jgi:hypothetical protein
MKWKIDGTDGSGDDVIVMVEADDAEAASRQAVFAGVKVKAVHPDESTQSAVKLPPANSVTAPSSSAPPPPGYTGKVVVEREEDDHGRSLSSRLHLSKADAGDIFNIASHIIALALLLIGIVVFLHGWIDYGRVEVPSPMLLDLTAPTTEASAAADSISLMRAVAWQEATAYVGQMLIGLLIVIIAIGIEGFMTRMVVNIRDVWHKKPA